MQAIRFLKDLDAADSITLAVEQSEGIEPDVISMAAHYLVKELVPIPVDRVSQQKISNSAGGSAEKARELLILFLGTSLLSHQTTGQFAGLSFAASEREIYAASLVVKTFYNLDEPEGPDPDTGRHFYRTRTVLWEKLLAVISRHGLTFDQSSIN